MTTTTTQPCSTSRGASPSPSPGAGPTRTLGRYTARDSDQQREVVSLKRSDESTLVVDYQLGTLADGRLIARLAPDEPPENAQVLCDLYLADATRGRCRAITAEDYEVAPDATAPLDIAATTPVAELRDAEGRSYAIRVIEGDGAPELRWTCSRPDNPQGRFDVLTLRDVVARVETYEPAYTNTRSALAEHGPNRTVSTHRLATEFDRLRESPIVLNRRLRETVQRTLLAGELTMSEIAQRCGRVKHDRRGNTSGETSWLARRIGQLPEGGSNRPCPWIHTDVLALIARAGLGLSPHEVEL
jgi:hypothetical protein